MIRSITFFLLFASATVYAQTEIPSLVGEWEGIDRTDTMTLVFEQDSIVTMFNKTRNQSIGGRDVMRKGKRVQLIYRVNTSDMPYEIDLIIQEIETKNELGRMAGIFEFINDRQMKINLGDKNRPVTFDNQSLIVTKRVSSH